ncbi:MAG: tyrosine--tRNA ligase [Acidilobaceae archaeon]
MDLDAKMSLITRNTVEVVTVEELRQKLESGEKLRGYIGYEPSGLVHVGWLVWIFKVWDLVEAGVDFTILEATWHAFINDKLGGDMDLIRKSARLTREVMEAMGVPVDKIRFVDAEEIASDPGYWALVLEVMKNNSLARIKRSLTIMGRRAEEAELDASKLVYPAMQVADIYYLDLDVALGGIDQRKAHMLARDTAEKKRIREFCERVLGRSLKKPIAIHTPIVTSLQGPGARMDVAGVEIDEVYSDVKMSKSKPESAIFLHDPPELIAEKLRKAYCPPRQLDYNPVVEIASYVLGARGRLELEIERPAKYGGPLVVSSVSELREAYARGDIHPLDLKNAVAEALAKLLEPARRLLESRGDLVREIESHVTR